MKGSLGGQQKQPISATCLGSCGAQHFLQVHRLLQHSVRMLLALERSPVIHKVPRALIHTSLSGCWQAP